jgi:endogenous inhibitor of DNA gyrase (YacG/DUF329 family)
MQVTCPTCHRSIDWKNAPHRPFCSERCRLIDLGGWLTGRNAIPGEPVAEEPGHPHETPADH